VNGIRETSNLWLGLSILSGVKIGYWALFGEQKEGQEMGGESYGGLSVKGKFQ